LSLLGQAFFSLGFSQEAVDTFKRAIGALDILGGDTSKDLYYNLGRALEQKGEAGEADKAYSQVMQWDFNYKDVRTRIQKLRNPPKPDAT
jgi:tetratricopeptide (TPR) repeat protein